MTAATLAQLTTMRVGGPARRLLDLDDTAGLVGAALDAWASGDDWLVLGGGSNLVVSDAGFDGIVLRVLTRGIVIDRTDDRVRLRVEAGEPWDDLVALTVENGWSGLEALSGIPGTVGASPIQNIGAYGQEVASSLVAVDFLDYGSGELERLPTAALELGYRTSAIKRGRAGLVTAVEFELHDEGGLSAPVGYGQLAAALGARVGDRVPLAALREAVLALRAAKGMVLNPHDPDSTSAGSFFTNPIVSENFARSLPPEAPRWLVTPDPGDVAVPLGSEPALPPTPAEARVKLSAAWLIESAGIHRGFRLPGSRAAISGKHTLAITNTGGATADEVVQLARYVQTRVLAEFGVALQPEPVLLGADLG